MKINGEVRPITDEDKQAILATNKDLAKQALRVLMMAYKITYLIVPTLESAIVESDLIFSGLVGMIDPERPEAAEAVRVAKEAGIRPIMITGDHQDTAEAIAKRLGIIDPNDTVKIMSLLELSLMSFLMKNSKKSSNSTLSMRVCLLNTRFVSLRLGKMMARLLP